MIFNMIGSNGPSMKSTIIVSVSTGSTVGAYTDAACTTLVKTATERSEGEFWITGLNNGLYYIKATKNTDESIVSYTINEFGVYRICMLYRTIPEFTYTGTYEVVEDDDTVISNVTKYNEPNWKIRFLTSGTLILSDLYEAIDGIDVFLVGGGGAGSNPGGGGAGGGGGYTKTIRGVTVSVNSPYLVTIGEGGAVGTKGVAIGANGGASSFGTLEPADGGYGGQNSVGGNGGSGGGSGYIANRAPDGETKLAGGSDGGNGSTYDSQSVGIGQGTTTREFGESSGKLYAGGGGGGSNQGSSAPSYGGAGGAGGGGHGHGTSSKPATAGEANTGGGGGAGANNTVNNTNTALLAGSGGSGIVIIRNAR